MKSKKKTVFYCDFCNKKGMSSFWMKLHESHCTKNPDRECSLCKRFTKDATANVTLTFDMLSGVSLEEAETMVNLAKGKINCPICAFSYFRLHGFSTNPVDLKKEVAEYWEKKNKDEIL